MFLTFSKLLKYWKLAHIKNLIFQHNREVKMSQIIVFWSDRKIKIPRNLVFRLNREI